MKPGGWLTHYTWLMNSDTATMASTDRSTDQSAYQTTDGRRIAVLRDAHDRQESLAASPVDVMFCGGFHSSMRGVKAEFLAALCKEKHWNYTRFDYRGHGESDGQAQDHDLGDWLDDTLLVLDSLTAPVVLTGSSMGAWLATLAAMQRPDKVAGLLLLAAAPDFLQELIEPRLGPAEQWELQQDSVVWLDNAWDTPYPITRRLLDSAGKLSLLNDSSGTERPSMDGLRCPVRLIHGTHDSDVPYTLSARLMDKIVHDDARLLLLHRADHRLSDERSLRAIAAELQDLAGQISSGPSGS